MMTLRYFIVGEVVLLWGLFQPGIQVVRVVSMHAAIFGSVMTVILWPVVIFAMLRDRFR
jgi:hypothetical protein